MSDENNDDPVITKIGDPPAEKAKKEAIPPRPKTTRGPNKKKAPERESLRDPVRAEMRENSLADAERRAREIEAGLPDDAEIGDQFAAPEPPPGWSYEWKREFLLNSPDPSYQRDLEQTGWTPVPAKRHPGMMPTGTTDSSIRRKGLILMERPMSITQKMRDKDARAAKQQVKFKEEQLGAAPTGAFPDDGKYDRERVRPNIAKSYEPMPVPKE